GRYLKMKEFKFGGKTGTADMNPLNTKEDYLASFEAFAPLDDPEVVILVMIEKPRSGKIYGGSVAGPVVARVLRRYFSIPAKPEFERLKFKGW
nr:penicillin-binding transpeptidase domain-containing protein [Planctomycetota bacterium]